MSKDKIQLGFEKVVALGFDVGLHEYSPKHALKKKVLECAMPTNKTRVQQWLGLVAQFGKHIDPHVLNEIRAVWSPITGEKKTIEDIPEIDRARGLHVFLNVTVCFCSVSKAPKTPTHFVILFH